MKDNFQLIGHTKIYKNGELVFEKKNAINNHLRTYLSNLIGDHTATNKAVSGTNLISNANQNKAGTDDDLIDKHGIMLASQVGGPRSVFLSMETITIHGEALNTYGKKWRGTVTVTSPTQFNYAVIGHNWKTATTDFPFFETVFATQTFTTQTLATNDTFVVEWEIAIV